MTLNLEPSRYDYHGDIAGVAYNRLNDKSGLWWNRISDMMAHASQYRPGMHFGLRLIRVPKAWPQSGAICIEREDGKRFRLYMTPKTHTFKIREYK